MEWTDEQTNVELMARYATEPYRQLLSIRTERRWSPECSRGIPLRDVRTLHGGRSRGELALLRGSYRRVVPGPCVDYERHGRTYAQHRRSDPRIAAAILRGLGGARTVLNVGAGTGSYEPSDRWVLAVEPSAVMRAQRDRSSAPAINARAESLPFDDNAVDAAMACVTIHHWGSPVAGLKELRRVAGGPVVVFTFDLDGLPPWQHRYLAEAVAADRPQFPSIDTVADALGGQTRVERLPTPGDCADGFIEAFWRRPESLLEPAVRSAQSVWARLAPGAEDRIVAQLARDLDSGAWDAEYGPLRAVDAYYGALRLVIST